MNINTVVKECVSVENAATFCILVDEEVVNQLISTNRRSNWSSSRSSFTWSNQAKSICIMNKTTRRSTAATIFSKQINLYIMNQTTRKSKAATIFSTQVNLYIMNKKTRRSTAATIFSKKTHYEKKKNGFITCRSVTLSNLTRQT